MGSPAGGNEFRAYGVRVLTWQHPQIRRLRKQYWPENHGDRVWGASYLLMDYLSRIRIPPGTRVMDVGCGWGAVGIHCARCHGARVTAVDLDSDVFPYLRLQARVNGVGLRILQQRYERITRSQLEDVDLLIGADVCFWNPLVPQLKALIQRALQAGVEAVLIADPGRPTFHRLAKHFVEAELGSEMEWKVGWPYLMEGCILRVDRPSIARTGS